MIPGASRTFERLGWSHLLEESTPHSFLAPWPLPTRSLPGATPCSTSSHSTVSTGLEISAPGARSLVAGTSGPGGSGTTQAHQSQWPPPLFRSRPRGSQYTRPIIGHRRCQLVIAATGRSSAPPFLPVEIESGCRRRLHSRPSSKMSARKPISRSLEAVVHGWIWWLPLGDGRASLHFYAIPPRSKRSVVQTSGSAPSNLSRDPLATVRPPVPGEPQRPRGSTRSLPGYCSPGMPSAPSTPSPVKDWKRLSSRRRPPPWPPATVLLGDASAANDGRSPTALGTGSVSDPPATSARSLPLGDEISRGTLLAARHALASRTNSGEPTGRPAVPFAAITTAPGLGCRRRSTGE